MSKLRRIPPYTKLSRSYVNHIRHDCLIHRHHVHHSLCRTFSSFPIVCQNPDTVFRSNRLKYLESSQFKYASYTPSFELKHPSEVLHSCALIENEQWKDNQVISVTGRIASRRDMGNKLSFLDILRDHVKLQVIFKKSEMNSDTFVESKAFSVGDHIEVSGIMGRTKAGEISVRARSARLLAPCIRMIPERLTHENIRYSKRYLDMIINKDLIHTLKLRSRVISFIRNYLDQRGFTEVETPILSAMSGGANARPFETQSAYNSRYELRISPEIRLKELLVGGFDRIYEIGKQFRNEGVDATHNPEFTTVEFYQSYANLDSLMTTTEELLSSMVTHVLGTSKVLLPGSDQIIHFDIPFQKIRVMHELERIIGPFPSMDSPDLSGFLHTQLRKVDVPIPECPTIPRLFDKLISHTIEPRCIQPTFLLDLPLIMSPLAKESSSHLNTAARFELYIGQKEFINAYEELNDPLEQRRRFSKQAQDRLAGDKEALRIDDGFCEALEYGLPPTGGWGLGVDRLVMLLANQRKIKDVISFPTFSG